MTILQKLTNWQKEQAQIEGVKGYMVLPFKTLQEISRVLPTNEIELLAVKGIGQFKVRKYGKIILNIVKGKTIEQKNFSNFQENVTNSFNEAEVIQKILESGESTEAETKFFNKINKIQQSLNPVKNKIDPETGEILDLENEPLSVSEALDVFNAVLVQNQLRIRGEITRIDSREKVIYFNLKDIEDGSTVDCLIFRNNYELNGIFLKEGMEIIIEAVAEIYKPTGRLSLKATSIELAGEGALKKAYEDLKQKFKKEGLLSSERKRKIKKSPEKIGLITSRDGAAIGDFMTNLGNYGFKISFCHSSVEGQKAVGDIMLALKTMRKKDLDLLVIVRGGGSLESLQAFNNEKIVREIANFPVPVIAGIGHEQDETLATLVADEGVSTPTAAARIVRGSWDLVKESLQYQENFLINYFENSLLNLKNKLQNSSEKMLNFFDQVQENFKNNENALKNNFQNLNFKLKEIKNNVNFAEKLLQQNNPENLLKLGYSIARDKNGKILRSIKSLKKDNLIDLQLKDGSVNAKIVR